MTVLRAQDRRADWLSKRAEAAAKGKNLAEVDRKYRQALRAFDSDGRSVRLVELRRTGDRGNVPTYKVVMKFD